MFFKLLDSIKYAAIFGIIVSIIASLWYITGLRGEVAVNKDTAEKLEKTLKHQEGVILQLKQDQLQISEINSILSARIKNQNKDLSALKDRFEKIGNGDAKTFAELAAKKPSLVEIAINQGSKNAARCLEIASGAPLTDEEKTATTPDKINQECPSLANPLYKQ